MRIYQSYSLRYNHDHCHIQILAVDKFRSVNDFVLNAEVLDVVTFRRNLLPPSSGTRKMDAVGFSEKLASLYQTTRRHFPKDRKTLHFSPGSAAVYRFAAAMGRDNTGVIV
jgi:hypothetical protein